MISHTVLERLREVVSNPLPLPAGGHTAERHSLLADIAQEDLSLAKLAEAHWDATAILAEAGRVPEQNAIYAVWASEVPGQPLQLIRTNGGVLLSGNKPFCSGIGMVDRALVTVGGPENLLVDVDLRINKTNIETDLGVWETDAFGDTKTGSLNFIEAKLDMDAQVGRDGIWKGPASGTEHVARPPAGWEELQG